MPVSTCLAVAGLALTLLGAGVAAWSVIITKEQAEKIGGGAWGGNFKLPKALVRQTRFTAAGLVLVAIGTALRIAGAVAACRAAVARSFEAQVGVS